ncbi:hypothetical protein ACFWIX_05970 [Pseudarthrobacter sp. NPDC058362]|uniref:hypothetical protein n=1 Tax=Pseudarthrobacter sp. NPDC058362 TaxID=3346458 RepID=UPI0036478176
MGSVAASLLAVTRAALKPALVMAVLFVGAGTVAAVATGVPDVPLSAALTGLIVSVTSLIVHETAHLLTARALLRQPSACSVHHSMTEVWIKTPPLGGKQNILTALAGPSAGIIWCLLAIPAGAPAWIAGAIAVVHGVNLLPFLADGRMLLVGLGQIFLAASRYSGPPPRRASAGARVHRRTCGSPPPPGGGS